jgi:hypothetical protein
MKHSLSSPIIAHLLHVGPEHGHVVAVLALDELRARGDLLGQAVNPEIKGRREGIDRRAQEHRGGEVSLRPERNFDSSRMMRMVSKSDMQSRSNTGLAPGWSPACTPSPVRHRTFWTPIAAAPSTSPWMAMRFLSRQEICRIGA